MGSYYRVRFRTREVVSAAIQSLSSHNVAKDNQIARLMGQNTVIADMGRGAGRAASNIGTGVLNIAFGLGSYFQGDVGGGLLITAGYAVSLGLIIWEVAGLKYEDSLAGIPGTAGLVAAGVTLAGGFVRPFVYNKSPRAALLLDRLVIYPAAEKGRINGLGILYTQSF
jgi:hypothetical protein